MKKSIHNLVNSPTYRSWSNMKTRCLNKRNERYKDYGGRGIRITKKWLNFDGFLEDMGVKPDGYTIERIDNEKDYCKENCCWIPLSEQSKNRRFNRRFTFRGTTKTLSEWSRELGINITTIVMRLDSYGWSLEKTLTTFPRKNNRK